MRAITITPWQPVSMVRMQSMGQTPLPMAPVAPPRPAFIDSPLAQVITDGVALTASSMLAWVFQKEKSEWSKLFYITAALSGIKLVADGYRLNRVNV